MIKIINEDTLSEKLTYSRPKTAVNIYDKNSRDNQINYIPSYKISEIDEFELPEESNKKSRLNHFPHKAKKPIKAKENKKFLNEVTVNRIPNIKENFEIREEVKSEIIRPQTSKLKNNVRPLSALKDIKKDKYIKKISNTSK